MARKAFYTLQKRFIRILFFWLNADMTWKTRFTSDIRPSVRHSFLRPSATHPSVRPLLIRPSVSAFYPS